MGSSFLEKCDGTNFKSEDTRGRELNELLDRLLVTHNSLDNYHHEVPIAKRIKKYITGETDILPNIEDKLIKTVLICRVGNGNWYNKGVSPIAKPIYDKIIRLFNSRQVNKILKFLQEPEIKSMLCINDCIYQTKSLLSLINLDLQEGRTMEALGFILENIDVYKDNIFSKKELEELLKFI